MGNPLAGLIHLYLLDWLTTCWLIERGGTEANPFISHLNLMGLLTLKLLVLALAALAYPVLRRLPLPAPYWPNMIRIGGAWFLLVNLWNLRLILQTY